MSAHWGPGTGVKANQSEPGRSAHHGTKEMINPVCSTNMPISLKGRTRSLDTPAIARFATKESMFLRMTTELDATADPPATAVGGV